MLLSSSNRKYQPYPLLSYFPWSCAWDVLLHHILSFIAYTFRENRDLVFIIIAQFIMSANSRIPFGLQLVFVCLYITPSHYHHYANLSEDIELIKCLSDIFCRVCEYDWAYSLLSDIQYMCFQFTHLPCDDWENIYIYKQMYFVLLSSSNLKYELLSIVMVRSWNNGMRCLYILIILITRFNITW